MHFRQCKLAFNAKGGGKASTVYDAIGAAQVAKASFAGMRLLHHLGDALAVIDGRSEEHTSELQSLMRISYAVFCLKKKTHLPLLPFLFYVPPLFLFFSLFISFLLFFLC